MLPWGGPSPTDKSGNVVDMMSKFIPLSYIETAEGRRKLAAGLIKVLQVGAGGQSFMTPKGQAGIAEALVREFNFTALNPVILDTAGTLLHMIQLPWFVDLAPSPELLQAIWWRNDSTATQDQPSGWVHDGVNGTPLRESVTLFTDDEETAAAVTAMCDRGAAGDVPQAIACMTKWQQELIPSMQAKGQKVRALLEEILPNVDQRGNPFSGSYWSETDYWEADFRLAYWGAEKYDRLLQIKRKYDPKSLFVCHHCVGSEFWTKESNLNCRKREPL